MSDTADAARAAAEKRRGLAAAFSPAAPIVDPALLAGRDVETERLRLAVLERGRHAAIVGPPGIGKTSLAATFAHTLRQDEARAQVIRVAADAADGFDGLWRKVFRRIKRSDAGGALMRAAASYPAPLTPDDVVAELADFPTDLLPVVVLDDCHRLPPAEDRARLADTVAGLARHGARCTLVMVGTAPSAAALLGADARWLGAAAECVLGALEREAVRQVVANRLEPLGFTIEPAALDRLAALAGGLPFFAHALGQQAALRALSRRDTAVTADDVAAAAPSALADANPACKQAYDRATRKLHQKANIYAEVMAACALAARDALAPFEAADLEAPLEALLGRAVKVPSFAFHLNALAKPARGPILEKTGGRRHIRYRFADPRMMPFIALRSLQTGLMAPALVDRFGVRDAGAAQRP